MGDDSSTTPRVFRHGRRGLSSKVGVGDLRHEVTSLGKQTR
ncbi:hypothetical protein VDGL01_05477 [Verticillium dahliae]